GSNSHVNFSYHPQRHIATWRKSSRCTNKRARMVHMAKTGPVLKTGQEAIEAAVFRFMPETDDETRRIVVAIAGLLTCVAFSDGQCTDAERTKVREELGRVQGLG